MGVHSVCSRRRTRGRKLQPDTATLVSEVDKELRARVRRESAERVARGISRQKIDTWILDVLGQRSSMEIRELLTLLQLLYVYLHGYDDLAKHQLGKNKEIEEQDTIQYTNCTLRRREKRNRSGEEVSGSSGKQVSRLPFRGKESTRTGTYRSSAWNCHAGDR